MRASLWPTGLIGRVSLVLFAAVILELLASTFVFEQAELTSSEDAQAQRMAVQLDGAARVLDVTSEDRRPVVAATMSDRIIKFSWSATHDIRPTRESDIGTRSLREKMVAVEPALLRRRFVLRNAVGPSRMLEGRLDLDDGSVLRFKAAAAGATLPNLYGQVGSIVVLSACVLLAALLLVRTLAAPLRMLVHATDAIGHGPAVQIDEQGPREIRRVAQAFNAMQARIRKLIKDRTEALAAVSHDLRTPIGRMRLRAGFLPLQEDQASFEADLAEMEAMLNDLLAYLGGDTDPEKPKRTDIASLLQTLADAATDAGHSAQYQGVDRLTVPVRSLALKRAFSNIVNNALSYGGSVRISLTEIGSRIVAHFDDDGPGIPEEERERVFEPFYRGDASRNRAKGGMGLGLAITRHAIRREDGTIELSNRAEGGLRVTVTLPGER